VHPYDDLAVVAGQGTIGLEMLAQQPSIDTLVVAIGGGGMISGMATAARSIKPGIRVIGVQTERFPAVWNAMHGRNNESAQATIADGIGVKSPGALTLPLIRERVDDVLLVGEDDIEQAILMLLEIEKTVVEGAGAVGLAALMKHRSVFVGRKVGLVLSGGNIEPLVLAEIIERGMVKSGRLARLRFDVRDVPGALADVAALLGKLGANIDEVQHQRAFTSLSVERAQIEVVVHTRGVAHIEEILAEMRAQGYRAERVG
jgi:threonine dehydratase